jgi:hypothetical protein
MEKSSPTARPAAAQAHCVARSPKLRLQLPTPIRISALPAVGYQAIPELPWATRARRLVFLHLQTRCFVRFFRACALVLDESQDMGSLPMSPRPGAAVCLPSCCQDTVTNAGPVATAVGAEDGPDAGRWETTSSGRAGSTRLSGSGSCVEVGRSCSRAAAHLTL